MQGNIGKKSSIRTRILIPLVVILALLLTGVYVTIYTLQAQDLDFDVTNGTDQVSALFSSLLERETAFLESQLNFIQQDSDLQQAFMSRDRDALYAAAMPIYETLNEKYRVTHFYFTDMNRVNFLRMHNPTASGDEITRFTQLEAERTGDMASGIELGILGQFTLRVVVPWRVDAANSVEGRTIGYLELGMEIDHLMALLHDVLESEFILTIDKTYLERESWEAGMVRMERDANWDRFNDFVIIDQSIQPVPEGLTEAVLLDIRSNGFNELNLNFNDEVYRSGALPLFDATGREVGTLYVLINVTTLVLGSNTSLLLFAAFALLLGGILTAGFYLYVGRIQNQQNTMVERLQEAYDDLNAHAITEQTNRESLERANIEIANRATTEERQRSDLESLLDRIVDAAQLLNQAAHEIQNAAVQQVTAAYQQDASVTEIVASVEQIRLTVLETADRARAVVKASESSMNVSTHGQDAVTKSIEGMVRIREQVDTIASTILTLSKQTQQIGDIIETVNELAEQSKLLALNASIEAARAGKEGRGFAVVATDVRHLAEQSRQATDRVRVILNDIRHATNAAVMVTEEGSKRVDQGMELAESAGSAIQTLAQTIENASQTSLQIMASSQQQTTGMEQLLTAIRQIKETTAQTASSTRQTEESAKNLVELAQNLDSTAQVYHGAVPVPY